MGYGRSRILNLVIIFLCGYLVVNLLFLPDYVYTPSPTVQEEISLVLSNRLSAGNSSWQSYVPVNELASNDSSQLIDITDFKFLINLPCLDSMYVVCVHSAPANLLKRQLIRKTWGIHVPLYFMLGETAPAEQHLLDTEANQFHDIVQGKFHDSYTNLTYKHTMIFKWVVYHCPHVKYVLKCDDDIFVNVAKLNDFIGNSLSPYGTQSLLMCPNVWHHDLVQRGYRSKWRVSYKEYPGRYYPPYCRGPIILYSPDVMFKLYQALQREQKYFWVDDVFITGMVFATQNLTHSNFNWWLGDNQSLVTINYENDLHKFDSQKNLFAFLNTSNMPKLFEYLNNITLVPSNRSLFSEELRESRGNW